MENEFPDQGLRRPDEQEDIPGPTVWTVQVGQAWIRSGPPDFRRRDTQLIPRGTRLIVLETQDAYAHVATTGQAEIGWTAQSNLTAYYSQQPDLLSTRLAPNQPITVEASWPAERRDLARTYNRLGGLLTALAARARLEVPGILAVWQVESGGSQHQPGQAIIRFENHLLWRSWGQYDPERFDASFQFGGRPPMTDPVRCAAPFRCHRYRPAATRTDPAPAWRSVHASQADEYAALRLAQGLAGDEPALTSISIGGPQILVANYSRLGYDSAREMYDAFQASEIAHVLGFADFCEHDGAGGATLQHLRDHDWSGFARRYNGPGQVASYATRLEAAYAEAAQLFHTGRTPATERAEPDAGEEPGLQERETAAIGGLAESGVARDRDLTDQTLSATIQDADLGRLFTARDPVVSGQPIQLGKGVTIDVIGAPRDTLATSPQAGDLLVRLVPGDRPVVAVLDNAQLRDSTAAAATGVPIELLLPGRYATVRQEGQSRLRRLVDAEGRVPVGQAVVRLNPPVEDQPERVPGPSPTRNSTWEAPASQDAPDHPSQIELQVGETFTLDLPSLMSAGYTWGHELLGPPGIIDLSWSAFSPASQPLGRGTERATVRALAPGQVTVRLVQHRSWERDKGPLSRRTIQITVRSTAADATAEAVSYRSAPAGAEHAAQPGEPVADRAGETVLQDANITPIPADTGIAYESTDTSWRPWTDLIVHQVPRPIVADLAKRGISIPQLKDAYGDINLDCYAVKISRMPFLHGNQLAPETLLAHIRRNFDAFVDTNNSSFPPLDNSIDKPRWESDSPLGAVINIHIHVLGTIDQGLVVCSRAEPRLWVFTTAHGGPAGYHPVTGNRMFGIRADGNEWVLFTRGADRATQFIDWVGNVVGSIWSGADALWRSFQAKVKDFISVNHGSAVVIQPKSERWSWEPIEYRLYRAHGEEVSSREQEEADGQAIWPSSLPTPR